MLSRSNMARVRQPHKRMVSPSGTAVLISPPARLGSHLVLALVHGLTRGRPHTLLDPRHGWALLDRRGREARPGHWEAVPERELLRERLRGDPPAPAYFTKIVPNIVG
jgi:hypothetical protein